MNATKGPFGGHHLGGDSRPPITFEVVPTLKIDVVPYPCWLVCLDPSCCKDSL